MQAARFVGRAAQLEELRAMLGARSGVVVVVAGEAGMGKSRLVRETVAGRLGPTLTGRLTGEGVRIPFRPLAEIALGALRAGADTGHASVRPYLPALNGLLPSMRDGAPAVGIPGPGTALVVAEGLVCLLATCGQPGLTVVIEDLHWADPDTASAIEYLVDHVNDVPMRLISTVRVEESPTIMDLIDSLVARRSARMITLNRLDSTAMAEMARACLKTDVLPDGLVDFLDRYAEGRPFFIEEILAGLVADRTLTRTDRGWMFDPSATARIPATYAASTDRRLAGLAPGQARVLQAASVLGREFDAALLGSMAKVGDPTVLDALRAGVRLQLLDTAPTDQRLRFRHAISRDAVMRTLLPPERAALAAAGLDAIEAGTTASDDTWCDLAARLAVDAGLRPRAVALLIRAGRRALSQGALSTAIALFDHAHEQAADDVGRTAAAEEALIEALALAGDSARTLDVGYRLLRTLGVAGAAPARQVGARLAVARAAAGAGRWPEARAMLSRVREMLAEAADDADTVGTQARVAALAALIEIGAGRDDEAAAYAGAALTDADDTEPGARCEALEVLGRLFRRHDPAAAGRYFTQALAVAERHGLRLWRARALHEVATVDFLITLDVAGLHRARVAALEAGAAGLVASIDLHLSAIHGVRFEADDALAAARRCVDASKRLGLTFQTAFSWICVAQAHAVAGRRTDTEGAIANARALVDDPEVEAYAWGQCHAVLSLVEEDRRRALTELERSMTHVRRGAAVSAAPYRGLWPLLATLDEDGADARAESHTPDVLGPSVTRGMLAYADAIVAGRAGDVAAADAAFGSGEAAFRLLHGPPGYHQLARRLVAEAALADGWGEPAAWLAEAHDWFAGRNLERLAGACRGLLRRAGVPQRRSGRGDSAVPPALAALGITSRETDVLRLVAEGLTNQDIAARLYLSPGTVKTHVERLLAKTALTSRVQLAARALAEGIGPSP